VIELANVLSTCDAIQSDWLSSTSVAQSDALGSTVRYMYLYSSQPFCQNSLERKQVKEQLNISLVTQR